MSDPLVSIVRKASRTTSLDRIVVGIAVAVFILLLPEFTISRHLFLATVTGTTAIVAYGLAVIFGQAGILSLAHAGLWAIGAYSGGIMSREFGMSYWEVLPIGIVFATVAAAILAYPALRIRGHFFLISTFAFGELVRIVLENGQGFHSGRRLGIIIGADSQGLPPFLGIPLESAASVYWVTVALLTIAMGAFLLIRRSGFGATLRAIRENEDLAESVGIRLARHKIIAFSVSGIFAGAAGVHYAFLMNHITPAIFGAQDGIQLALIVLLGGSVPLLGPLVGASAVIFLPELPFANNVNIIQIGYGLALIVLILLLPSGMVVGVKSAYFYLRRQILAMILMGRPPPSVT